MINDYDLKIVTLLQAHGRLRNQGLIQLVAGHHSVSPVKTSVMLNRLKENGQMNALPVMYQKRA